MRFVAGDLKERVAFLAANRTNDRGFASETYSVVCTVWARVRLQGGTNENTQNRRAAKLAIDLDMRYRADITDEMRIVWRGRTFEISGPLQIEPIEGRMSISALEDESLSLAVDHITVSPSSVFLAPLGTQQLIATCFNENGDVVPSVVAWSTSDPTIATVGASTGIVTGVAAGTVTITATCEGQIGTASASVAIPLSFLLDWAPLARRADLAQPLVFVPRVNPLEPGDGYHISWPKFIGCGTLGTSRAIFPKSATEWGGYAKIDALMGDNYRPTNFGTLNQLVNQGPFDNTTAWQCYAATVGGDVLIMNDQWHNPDAMDLQEVTTWKRGLAIAVKADPTRPQDIGKQLRIGLSDSAHLAGAVFLKGPSLITLTANWQHFYVEWDSYAQFSGLPDQKFMIQIAQDDTGYIVAPYSSWNWHAHETNDPSNWARPLPWNESLGLVSQFQHQNSWAPDSDLPVLYGGATRASTAIAAPDSPRHYGGRTLSEYTLPANNDGITTSGPFRCEQASDVYPTGNPTGAVWLHWYIEAGAGALPADGALKGYLVGTRTGTTYGPISLTRDLSGPLSRFYRCRVLVNQFATKFWTIASGAQNGAGVYRFTTSATHNLLVGDQITVSGASISALNAQWTITVVTGTTFSVATTAANSTGGAVATGDLDFTPRIVNASGGQLKFNATRAAMTAENPRSFGYHHALVPKRCVTAPVYNEAAWMDIPSTVSILSVEEGLWIYRHVPIFGLTDIVNLNGNASDFDQSNYLSPCLWQSGPVGSADASFNFDVRRSQTVGCIDLLIQMQRGNPVNQGDWVQWQASITAIPASATSFPRLVATDFALAWKNHAVVAFGIGHGAGAGVTWLNHGDTFLGGTVSITTGNGLTWDLDIVNNDSHIGLAADRDVIRQTGGFVQAIAAGRTGSVSPATVKASLALHIAQWGARQDYR